MVFTFSYPNNQSSLLLVNNTVCRIKLIYDTESCSQTDQRSSTATIRELLDFELESAFRAILYVFLKGQALFQIQTRHFIFTSSAKSWNPSRKLDFRQNGKRIGACSELLEIQVLAKRIESDFSHGTDQAKSNRKRSVDAALTRTCPGESNRTTGASRPKRKCRQILVIPDSDSEPDTCVVNQDRKRNEPSKCCHASNVSRRESSKSHLEEMEPGTSMDMNGQRLDRPMTRSRAKDQSERVHPIPITARRERKQVEQESETEHTESRSLRCGRQLEVLGGSSTHNANQTKRRMIHNRNNFGVDQSHMTKSQVAETQPLRQREQFLDEADNNGTRNGQRLRSSRTVTMGAGNINNSNVDNTTSAAVSIAPEVNLHGSNRRAAATTPSQTGPTSTLRPTPVHTRRNPAPDQFAIQSEELSEALKLQQMAQPSQALNQHQRPASAEDSPSRRRNPRKPRRTSLGAAITSAFDYVVLTPLKHLVGRRQ